MMDIDYLMNFSQLSYADQCVAIENGRPTPDLSLTQRKGTKVIRKFSSSWYDRKDWLCGCAAKNRLYCYPCLLFTVTRKNVWVKDGFCDLNNLTVALGKHEKSTAHATCQASLRHFSTSARNQDIVAGNNHPHDVKINNNVIKDHIKVEVEPNLDGTATNCSNNVLHQHVLLAKPMAFDEHNAKVKVNRELLKKFISATCFLLKQELPFRGNNEDKSSLNRGNYIELVNYTSRFDEQLTAHLENSSVFSGLSNNIQNDLIEAIVTVLENNIKEEIAMVPFVAIEVDETTDTSNTTHCSTVFRYLLGSEIKETFIGFSVLQERSAVGVAQCVFHNLEKYNCAEKLVAQTYDGAVVTPSELNGVQNLIKVKSSSALFTHCYAHNLNLVLSESLKLIAECTSFFKISEALASFFTCSTKRTQLLDEVVQRRFPKRHIPPTRWSSSSTLIPTILQYHCDLCTYFASFNENPSQWDPDTLIRSQGFYTWLMQDSTYFFLMIYNEIFIKTDTLFNILQTKMLDLPYCIEKINETICQLQDLRRSFDDVSDIFDKYCRDSNLIESKFGGCWSIKIERERIFGLILDNVLIHMKARFSDFKDLAFITLLDHKKYQTSCIFRIDADALDCLERLYGQFFDIDRLQSDLSGMFSSQELQDKSPKDILVHLCQNGLTSVYAEGVKLLQLVLTIPSTAVSVERPFSTLKKIKSLTRNRMTNHRLSSLDLICIEKERFIKMERTSTSDFYEKVADIFAAKKKRRMNFLYK